METKVTRDPTPFAAAIAAGRGTHSRAQASRTAIARGVLNSCELNDMPPVIAHRVINSRAALPTS
jgi:hypothetical protein